MGTEQPAPRPDLDPDLDLRARFRAEGRTRWSEADADGRVTVHFTSPEGPDSAEDAREQPEDRETATDADRS